MNRAERRRSQKEATKIAKMAKPGRAADRSPKQQSLFIQQALDVAVRHHNAGDLRQAEGIYQQILQADPKQPVALHLLGVIAHQRGKSEVSVDLITRALAIKPDFVEAHNNLGLALQALGKLDEAAASYRKALTINANYAKAHNNLGNALKALGKLDEAVASYHKALAIEPGYAEAHNNLGNALKALGKLDEAVASLHKALAIKPDHAKTHNNLGNALKDLGKLEEAVASYRRALTIEPDFAEAHSNIGNALKTLGKLEEAVASYHRALAIKPDFAEAHYNLGNALQALGKMDEAVTSYHKALAIKPSLTEAHLHLAVVNKFSEYDNDIKAMEDAYAMPGLGDEERMYLAFGLGKSFEDLRQHEKAFEFFTTGNAIRRGSYDYSMESVEKNAVSLKELFTENLFAKHQGAGSPDETPIFILGMPRSGTTLVEQILASHPTVYGAGEIAELDEVVTSFFGSSGGATLADGVNRASTEHFLGAGSEYISRIRERSGTARFITNKMPANFWVIGLIRLMLPNAKVIHCRRDARDTCLSIFKNYFSGDGNRYAYDLVELGR